MNNPSDFGIYQLKINIQTSIPGQDNLILTSDMLNYTGDAKLEKYPFFSTISKYPSKKLKTKKYNEIVEFFFILTNFKKKIRKNNTRRENKKTDTTNNKTQNANNSEKKQKDSLVIKQTNFILMLKLLFPTVYPIVDNIDTSIGILYNQPEEDEEKEKEIKKEGEEEETNLEEYEVFDDKPNPTDAANSTEKKTETNTTSVFDFKNIQSFFSLKGTDNFGIFQNLIKKFSYLKIGGQEYTITRTIWLNDVMNHPIYSDIIKTYQKFMIWKSTKQEIHDKKEKWNIVILLFDFMFKTKSGLEEMNEIAGVSKIETSNNVIFNEQLKTIKTILETTYKNIFGFVSEKENPEYNTKRKRLFDIYKSQETNLLYDELEKLSTAYNRIQYPTITNSYKGFLRELKDKINFYNQMKKYDKYVNNLNFEFLSEEKQKTDPSLVDAARNISNSYPEFNNFVSKIKNMKLRVIDNPIWKKVIESIIKGNKYHNFQTKIWKRIDTCYGLSDDYEAQMKDDDNEDGFKDDVKLMKGGGCGVNEIVLQVNFDETKDTDALKNPSMKLMDLYLQMDVIEGKIDENNEKLIKCDYTNTELGNTWDILMNQNQSWDLSQIMMFYSAKKKLASGEESSTTTTTNTRQNTDNIPIKVGGSDKKSNLYSDFF